MTSRTLLAPLLLALLLGCEGEPVHRTDDDATESGTETGAPSFRDQSCGGFCCDLCDTGDLGCSGCKAKPASGCAGGASFDCPLGQCYNGEAACGNVGEPWTAGCC